MPKTDIGAAVLYLKTDGEESFYNSLKQAKNLLEALNYKLQRYNNEQDLYGSKADLMAKKTKTLGESYKLQTERIKILKRELEEINNIKDDSKRNFRLAGWQRDLEGTKASLAQIKAEWVKIAFEEERANSKLYQTGQRLQDISGKLKAYSQKLSNLGNKLSIGITTPVLLGAKKAIDEAREYESALADVKKVTNMNEEDAKAFGQSMMDLSSKIPMTTNELLKIAEAGGRLYKSRTDLTKYTETVAHLGNTTDLSLDAGIEALTQFMNIMGENVTNIHRVGSSVVDLGNNFATSESKIVAMSNRVASAGKLVGMSSDQVLALSAAMTSLGIRADRGGTSMSKFMTRVDKAVMTGNEDLQTFAEVSGTSAFEFAKAWKKEPLEALTMFFEGMGKIQESGGNLYSVFDRLDIREQRLADTLRLLSTGHEQLRKAMDHSNSAWQKGTALIEEATQRYSTHAAKVEIQKNRLQNLAVTVGEKLLPIFADLFEMLNNTLEGFNKLSPSTQNMILKTIALSAALGPLLKMLSGLMSIGGTILGGAGQIMKHISDYQSAAKLTARSVAELGDKVDVLSIKFPKLSSALGAVTSFLSGPLGIAVAASVATVALVALANKPYKDIQRLKEEGEELAKSLNNIGTEAGGNAQKAELLSQRIFELANNSKRSSAETRLLKTYIAQLNETVPGLGLAFDGVKGSLNMSTEAVKNFIEAAKNTAKIKAYADQLGKEMEHLAKIDMGIEKKKDQIEKLNTYFELVTKSGMNWSEVMKEYGVQVRDTVNQVNEDLGTHYDALREGSMGMTKMNTMVRNSLDELVKEKENASERVKLAEEVTRKAYEETNNKHKETALSTIDMTKQKTEAAKAGAAAYKDAMIEENLIDEERKQKIKDLQEAFEKALPGIAKAMTESLSGASSKLKLSLDDVEKNLKRNVSVLSKWKEDLAYIAEQAGSDVATALMQLGPEGRDIVGQLVNELKKSTDGKMPEFVDLLKQYAELSGKTFDSLPVELPEKTKSAIDKSGQAAQNAANNGSALSSGLKSVAEQGAKAYDEKMSGLDKSTGDAIDQAALVAQSLAGGMGLTTPFNMLGMTAKQSFVDAIAGISDSMKKLPGQLAEAVNANSDSFAKSVEGMASKGLAASKRHMSLYFNVGKQMGDNLSNGLKQSSAKIQSDVSNTIVLSVAAANSRAAGMKQAGVKIGRSLDQGIQSQAPLVIRTISNMVTSSAQQASGRSGEMARAGDAIGKAFVSSISRQNSLAERAGSGLGQLAYNGTNKFRTAISNVGRNFGIGFARGIDSTRSYVYNRAYSLGKQAINAVKAATQTRSPSRKAKKLGYFFGRGYGEGVISQYGFVENSVVGMSQIAMNSVDSMNKVVESSQNSLNKLEKASFKIDKPLTNTEKVMALSSKIIEAMKDKTMASLEPLKQLEKLAGKSMLMLSKLGNAALITQDSISGLWGQDAISQIANRGQYIPKIDSVNSPSIGTIVFNYNSAGGDEAETFKRFSNYISNEINRAFAGVVPV